MCLGWWEGSPGSDSTFYIPQVSTHGYSQNQILVWKYPSLTQVAKLTGHSYRVLYLVSLHWWVPDPALDLWEGRVQIHLATSPTWAYWVGLGMGSSRPAPMFCFQMLIVLSL